MLPKDDICYQALVSRDRRFDGVLFVGVTTTHVYCRPVCPARTARRDHCVFFACAAAAECRGFRPCLRCRPELAPGHATIDMANRVAVEVAGRIEAGALNGQGVDDLAAEFHLSARQMRRLVKRELGATPVELAQTQRLLLAKRLLTDSALPVIDVAFASGFSSVRQFNSLFRSCYGLSPTLLRRGRQRPPRESFVIEVGYRPPYAWDLFLRFIAQRATPGVECVVEGRYLRTVQIGTERGWLAVEPSATKRHVLRVELSLSLLRAIAATLASIRHFFDLDAHVDTVETHLARDPMLGPIVARQSGLRLPGAFDGFELATRAVLGQQISVAAATTLAGRLASSLGDPIDTPYPDLNRLAVAPERLASCSATELARLGIIKARAECLRSLARAVASKSLQLGARTDAAHTIEQVQCLPGIGEWTAHYIAMRALRWPDAFPHADLGLRKALDLSSARQVLQRAERWRPWRAYAAMHLWHSLAPTTRKR